MKDDILERGLNSRYLIKKVLGYYPPWQGFGVTDSLSEKGYLLFSVAPPAGISLSLEDIMMRDFLFAKAGGVFSQTISMQKNNGGITFLLPYADLIPLTKALPSMKPKKIHEIMKNLVLQIFIRHRMGLFFHNLTPESLVIANGSLHILPTAYLIPGEVYHFISEAHQAAVSCDEPLHKDLKDLGEILEIFSRYTNSEESSTLQSLSRRLCSVGSGTRSDELYELVEEIGSLLETPELKSFSFVSRKLPYSLPTITLRALKQAAIKAKHGERQLFIVKGKSGEGKTRFLKVVAEKLTREWGFQRGMILTDQSMFQTAETRELHDECDFVIVDDHSQEKLLSCHIIDRLYQDLEQCKLAVVAVSDESPDYFINALHEQGKKDINILDISLPVVSSTEKKRIISQNIPKWLDKSFLKAFNTKRSLSFMNFDLNAVLLDDTQHMIREGKSFLDTLSTEERSVLNFMAIFKFEVPLSFLQNIYSTEEDSIYTTLQRLRAKNLIDTRVQTSSLANDELCLVYSLSGRSLSKKILETIPAKRKRQIHKNIALILKEIKRASSLFIFYHLAKGGRTVEAAIKGYDLFQSLLKSKKMSAINCFNESYLNEKLDRHLPPEMRFKLLLELGNYFSLVGSIGKAETFYRRCREETNKEEKIQEFRGLAVEAVRRECEILEKKGEFLKAEKLLLKALRSHGEHLLSHERAKLYNDLAWIHYRLGLFDKSWENCLLVHRLLDEKQHPIEIAQSYNLMGAINWNRSKYDEAVLCHKRCLTIREDCNDEIGIAASYNNLGLVYRSMGQLKDALECFKRSMETKMRHNNLPGMAAAHLNLALAYLDMDKLKEAEKNCMIATKLGEDIGNQQLLAEACGTLGEIHFLQGNFEKARNYYFRDLHLCNTTRSQREKAVALRRLGELSLAEEKMTETMTLLQQAKTLNQKIGSRLETTLLNVLEGRLLLVEGNREEGRRILEGCGLELSLLGRKNKAAAITAEIGNMYMEEGNEPLSREYLLRAISLVGDGENIPHQVNQLLETLDRKSHLSLDQIQSDSERFKTLCRVISLIRTTQDPDKFYRTITETAKEITGMERAALILRNDGNDTCRILADSGTFGTGGVLTDKDIIAILNITKQLGYPLDIARTRIPGCKASEEFLEQHPGIICIPLWIRGEVTGFLYMDSAIRTPSISDKDRSFLVAFSQQVALGLEKIFLSEKISHMEKPKSIARPVIVRSKGRITFTDIIGTSLAMKHIFELIEGIKEMDTTVLLTGENGTGKDLIAKAIHSTGLRSDKPFVSLNCAAIPKELLESELFGHERGAFTGAHRQRIGHFESANGGTIFLNEIGDMPLSLQPKLLRVLEEQKFYRVGGTREITTDVRIITATNQDLLDLIKAGQFREDLYYRINIFPIRIPALMERKEDIESLCHHFLATYCRLYNITKKKVSPEAMTYLIDYDWPGNVRELENTINRMIIISKKDTILTEDLPEDIVKRPETVQETVRTTLEETIESMLNSLELSKSDPILPKVEYLVIRKTVDRVRDKTKAAALLGISKPTLYNKLKNYEKNRR